MSRGSLAESALPHLRSVSSGWLRGRCPYCEAAGHRDKKASFGVSPSGFFSCFRCGVKGKLDGAIYVPRERPKAPEPGVMGPPDGFDYITEEPAWSSASYAPARAYLEGRGVSRALAREVKLGAVLNGRYHHRVVIPVLGDDGSWLGWVGRVWKKKAELPYVYPPGEWRGASLYNHAALRVKTDQPAIVVEGCFDGIALWPHGVAVLGKPTAWQVEALVAAERPIAVVLDGDAHREGWALAQLLRARGQRAGSVRLEAGDDPDEVPRAWLDEEVLRCIK